MAEITTINASDKIVDSRAVINTNFSNINTEVVTHIADEAKHLTSGQNTWIDAITATAAEVNLLDLSGLTVGWVLRATGASAAAWGALVEADISDLTHYTSSDFNTDFGTKDTDDLNEGAVNKYDIDHFSGKTQDNLPDGTTYKQYNPSSVAIIGGTIDGITVSDLLDKSATETITGAWTHTTTLAIKGVGANRIFTNTTYRASQSLGPAIWFRHSNSDTEAYVVTVDGFDLGKFSFYGVGSDANSWDLGAEILVEQDGAAGAANIPGRIIFKTATNTATPIEALRIDSSQRVGIGTPTPRSTLHIKANVPGTVGSHPAGQLIIQDPDDTVFGNAVITGYESDGAGNPDQQLWYLGSSSSSNVDITFLNRRNANLHLGTNGVSCMTIDGAGNFGFGVSALETWKSTYSAIQIGKTAGFSSISTNPHGNRIYFSQNAYIDETSGVWEYQNTNVATQYIQQVGVHSFKVAASGTADTAISFITALTINNDGIIDMGKQSRAAGYRSAVQDVAQGSFVTLIFDTEEYDEQGEYNTGTGEFTATKSGYYLVTASIVWNEAITAVEKQIRYYVDAAIMYSFRLDSAVGALDTTATADVIYAAAGQKITVRVYHTFTEAREIKGSFAIHKLS